MIVTDYNGEVVEFAGSEEDALKQGYNVNCVNCTNCRGCSGCIDCLDCHHCHCCKNCFDCKRCIHCIFCANCYNCINCHNCRHCDSCDKCSDCNNCEDCKNFTKPIVLTTDIWQVQISGTIMQIGCKRFTIEQWFAFSDEEIAKMEERALEWWKKWKSIIVEITKKQTN